MARFLSPEWLAESTAAVASSEAIRRQTAGVTLTIRQVVTAGPDGDVAYRCVIDDGAVTLLPEDGDADVTFTQAYDTASRVNRGELTAQVAFMTGRIRVSGDMPRLLAAQGALQGIEDVFADVRSSTTY